MTAVRVALVTHYYASHRGGVESVAGQLASRLAATGRYEITWIASGVSAPPEAVDTGFASIPVRAWNRLERSGFPWPVWGPRGLARLSRAIAGCDVVHVHDYLYFPSIAAFVLARRWRKPVLITQHIGDVPFPNRLLSATIRALNRTIGRWMLGRADQVVFISAAVQASFERFVHFRRPPLHVANGVDTGVFHPLSPAPRERLRAQLDIEPADRVVLYVGRFVEKKGLPLLGRLARALPSYRWWFAGWGEPGSPAHPAAWSLPGVRVFGDRSGASLAELYAAADLLVLASLSEGFPLVVQESMACGTPVLIAERIADGAPEARPLLRLASIDGPDAVDAWTGAIAQALAEDSGRVRAGALVDFARAHWSWTATVERYDAIFGAALVASADSAR